LGPTRTKGDEVAHGSTLARTVAEGLATRQGRGEYGLTTRRRRITMQGNGTRRRSYGGGFLREMWEHGDIGPSYATVISDGARVVVSRTRARSRVRCTRGSKLEEEEANRR
jgi:hypothetical protein